VKLRDPPSCERQPAAEDYGVVDPAGGTAELQAGGAQARRVVAKVEFHCGELFPRVGFIVTNLGTSSLAVVRFYNKRGAAEQWDKGRQTGGRDDAA
jgi:hypothetical protein